MKYFIKTFGCQMNEQDSEVMSALLTGEGHQKTAHSGEADLILINTCSIREKAYHKAMSEIGRYAASRYRREGVTIGVAGCVASQEGERILKIPHVNFVVGTDRIAELPRLVRETKGHDVRRVAARRVAADFQDISDYEFPTPLAGWEPRVKAFVTIMKGCDNTCAFCIVPMTRGAEVSRDPDEIVREVARLRETGVREVMLLGQNVNSYGKKLGVTFACLLRRIEEETGIDRLRFTSPHPKDLSEGLIEEYARNRRLCPHIHLPVQSGSDRILKKMQRAYSREVYLRKVRKVREAREGLAITTDFIVGFPGETEDDFRQTLTLIEEAGFDQSYAFAFSPRPGTAAALLPDDVPPEVKKERLSRLFALQERVSLEKMRERVGKVEEVLVEGSSEAGGSPRWQGQLTGRTPQGRIVNFDGGRELIGAIIRIGIEEASPFSLKGRIDAD